MAAGGRPLRLPLTLHRVLAQGLLVPPPPTSWPFEGSISFHLLKFKLRMGDEGTSAVEIRNKHNHDVQKHRHFGFNVMKSRNQILPYRKQKYDKM